MSCINAIRFKFLMISMFWVWANAAAAVKVGKNHFKFYQLLEEQVWYAPAAIVPELELKIVKILQTNPNSSFASFLMSHLSIRRFYTNPVRADYLADALKHAEQSLRLNPRLPYGYAAVVDVLNIMKSPDKALTVLNLAKSELGEKRFQASWRLRIREVELTRQNKPLSEVEFLYLDLARSFPKVFLRQVESRLIEILSKQYILKPMILTQRFKKYFDEFGTPSLGFAYYTVLVSQDKYSLAMSVLDDIEKLDLSQEWIDNTHVSRVELLIAQKKYKLARKYLRSFPKLKTETSVNILMRDQMMRLRLAARENKKSIALKHSLQVVMNSSHFNKQALDLMIDILSEEHHSDEWEPDFLKEWLKLRPGYPQLYLMAANVVMDETHQLYARAESYFRAALLLQKNLSGAHSGLGVVLLQQGKYAEAVDELTIAVKQNPADGVARYNLACANSLIGNLNQALKDLQEAFELSPALRVHAMTDSDLDPLRELDKFHQLVKKS